jgi:hypothetical protein
MSCYKNFQTFGVRGKVSLLVAMLAVAGGVTTVQGQSQTLESLKFRTFKKQPAIDLLSAGGIAAVFGPDMAVSSPGEAKRGGHDHGRGGNTFVNDPCLDPRPEAPFPTNFQRTVQSETEIAVLNTPRSMGKKMVAGYNDSWGFYDNRQGLSGFAYSTNGGNTWIDGGGLPPRIPSGVPSGTLGSDAYFGDPVLVVHHQSQTFYYSSIYQRPDGFLTLSVNRGHFEKAPPSATAPTESISNTRCANDPTEFGIPDPPSNQDERIIWELPVEAVLPPYLGAGNLDFLDKEWLYVDQNTGTLYLTYTRFATDGATPIELVRCVGCANRPTFTTGDFTPPSVIVPNEAFEFNQATQAFTTPSGRVIVTWFARQFGSTTPFPEIAQRIEYAYSDDDGVTFTPEQLVSVVNPQGEPAGYNRGRPTILNAPYIVVDRGADDGLFTSGEEAQPGFGNVYITYFSGKTPLSSITKAADIFLSTSTNNGTTFGPPVKVNDDNTNTVHVFPSVQANKHGDVYVAWIDRREDPAPFVPPNTGGNIFNDTYAAVSKNQGLGFGHNQLQTRVSTSWFTREDARPDYGDYNSSELLGFNQFVTIWADGRFPVGTFVDIRPPATTGPTRLAATPDVIFTITQGLGVGGGSD